MVHVSHPRHEELALLVARRQAIETLTARLLADAELLDCIAAHPWLNEPAAHESELLEHPEYLTALMIALDVGGRTIPPAAPSCSASRCRPAGAHLDLAGTAIRWAAERAE